MTILESRIHQNLQLENKEIKQSIGRVTNLIENFIGNPELSLACNIPSGSDNLISTIDYLAKNGNVDNLDSVNLLNAHPEFEKIVMAKNAARAMEELIDHLINDNPFWIKFQNNGNYEFDSNNYDKFYYGSKIQRDPKSRVEYSKYSDIVTMNAKVLVDLLLDSDQWVDNFPTIISKATTVSVIEAGSLDNRSGSLQLVYKKMHSLPPINRPREYTLLQHCQEIKTGLWVIVNVSYNMFGGTYHNAPIHYWKHPSGWMIEQLPNGISKVTCVEHVEVNFNLPNYDDQVKNTLGFCAKRWVTTLQKTSELYSYMTEHVTQGRRSMMMLSRRMIKKYCSTFSLFEDANTYELKSNRVKIDVVKNTTSDLPTGLVISVARSFWVPASPNKVVEFLSDYTTRSQWDVLCNGNPVHEMIRIPTGIQSINAISILQPMNPNERSEMIFQEIMTGPYESLIVYAAINEQNMIGVTNGMDCSSIPILASGFAITPNVIGGRAAPSASSSVTHLGGSLITVAFQVLACSSLDTIYVGDKPSKATKMVNNVVNTLKVVFKRPV
ncbi:homeobox-leucine zipper protein ROC8-like [Chenopodium quinoa]|uniref:homeobox-leucine zipper protein ROC8-like n=1 Tax=Chenopodium quinoa TaxID=63459 RepID=UPI000B7710A5|nr:homeobox-leucine zipper protein ROC8-like [Chenopodium quinoa]